MRVTEHTGPIQHADGWRELPDAVDLPPDEVHVWRALLNVSAPGLRRAKSVLSPGERERAGRFRFERDRRRFLIAHAVLRAICGRYLRLPPQEVRFSHGPHGKPALQETGAADVRFNLSHSHDLALYAFALGRDVGIDVERIRHDIDVLELAEQFLCPGEARALHTLSDTVRRTALFATWTRKEAYAKALGLGLQLAPSEYEVSVDLHSSPKLLRAPEGREEACRWQLRTLTPGPDYVGTLAAEGHGWQLRRWQWPGDAL